VVLVSEGFWTRALSGDPDVIGRTIDLDERTVTIIGVMPAASDFGIFQILSSAAYGRSFADGGARAAVDIWMPLQASEEIYPRQTHPILVVGRLADDASVVTAQEEIGAIAADLERDYPENDGRGAFIEPLDSVVLGPIRPALLMLLGAVSLVLLVACANVANLLLARGAARRREVAVRTALGAGGARLARQFLVESLLLTFAAAALGIGVAEAGLRALLSLAPAAIPRIADATIDLRVLTVTLAVSTGVSLLFGLVPTLQARHVDLQSALKGGGGHGGSAGRERRRMRSALVVAELALAVILVVGAGLLIKSFWQLQQIDPGFTAGGVMKAEYNLPQSRYPIDFDRWPDFSEQHAFTRALLERAQALPGVEAAAIGGNHPLDAGFTNSFAIVGREAEADAWPEISVRSVTPGYFETVGIPLIRGRLFRDADGTFDPAVAVINEASARRFFGDRDPLGAEIRLFGTPRPIVGVVGNEHFHGLTEAPPLGLYLPLAQLPRTNGAAVLLARTAGDPRQLAGLLRRAIAAEDPALAVFGVEPLTETVSRSIAERRFTMLVLGIFAAVALTLAAIGIYGVLSYTVTQRTAELGIRMALGADPGGLRRLVVGGGLALASTGVAVGLVGAWILSRMLESLLFGVAPTDPAVFATVAALLLAVAALASYLPARRAARVDPMVALRTE
jgi:putative ABC transport system permease protein